jgi:hypothetical protein
MALLYIGACGSGNPANKLLDVSIEPRTAAAYANSNQNQVVFSVVARYLNSGDVTITSGVEWLAIGGWVNFDSPSGTAICMEQAPEDTFLYPKPAMISATITLDGQTFHDTVTLFCL